MKCKDSLANKQLMLLLHALPANDRFWPDFVEKVASLKSLQICQNTKDIFD